VSGNNRLGKVARRRKNVGVVDDEDLWEIEDRRGVVVA
jgi:hypothetical protein